MKQLRELYEYREMIFSLVKKIYAADIKALYWDFVDIYQSVITACRVYPCVFGYHESRL